MPRQIGRFCETYWRFGMSTRPWLADLRLAAVGGCRASSDRNNVHELYVMCDDIAAFVAQMTARVIECAPIKDEGWGLLTQLTLRGGKIGVYQPRHPRPSART